MRTATVLLLLAVSPLPGQELDRWVRTVETDPFDDSQFDYATFMTMEGEEFMAMSFACLGDDVSLTVGAGYMVGSGGRVDLTIRIGSNEAVETKASVDESGRLAVVPWTTAVRLFHQYSTASDSDPLAIRVVDPASGGRVQAVRTMAGARETFRALSCQEQASLAEEIDAPRDDGGVRQAEPPSGYRAVTHSLNRATYDVRSCQDWEVRVPDARRIWFQTVDAAVEAGFRAADPRTCASGAPVTSPSSPVRGGAAAPASTRVPNFRAHCQREWPNDARMRTFCVEQQEEAVADKRRLVASNGGVPAAAFGTALTGCEREWPSDVRMQVFCLEQQIEGYQTVASGPRSLGVDASASERAQIQRVCRSEWPDDFRMRAFCEEQQLEGLVEVKESRSPKKAQCRREWPDDFRMQAFCIKN